MIEDALEHLVKGIVDHPSDVEVEQKNNKAWSYFRSYS